MKRTRIRFSRAFLLLSCLFTTLICGSLFAEEKILEFDSDIAVNKDSTMLVKEKIRVIAEGRQIRHGIFRDFPTIYRDRLGNPHIVGFHIKEILRDGQEESYHIAKEYNGVRTYVGNKEQFVPSGEHLYTITYATDRQLGFFADHDELYWNVTGNGWDFPIEQVSATVNLPDEISRSDVKLLGYTGREGSREQALTSSIGGDNKLHFSSTRSLGAHEGLTIVATWPKNFINEPTALMRLQYLLRDNIGLAYIFVAVIALLFYYLLVWAKVGKDPKGATIIPLFNPPDGISPAAMRYVEKMKYDNKAFAAAIINMAVKGVLTIQEEKPLIPLLMKKTYVLRKKKESGDLSAEESAIFSGLFSYGSEVSLSNSYDSTIAQTVIFVSRQLKRTCEGIYFTNNSSYFGLGLVFSFLTVFLSLTLSSRVIIPPYGFLILIPSMIVINILFYWLLKAPTKKGRELMDKIEGFKMFLSVTEKDRLNLLNPPQKTPELFEKFLPFALALGVEQKWGEQFAHVFATPNNPNGVPYSPYWYSGASWSSLNPSTFATSVGDSVSHVISSAATPPGSSSGGGGGSSSGGSSGGGGGGGGGGGW